MAAFMLLLLLLPPPFFQLVVLQARASSFTYKYVSASSPPYNIHQAYKNTYPPPPPPPPHHHHKPKQLQLLHSQRALVTGHVYCDTCKNGQLKEPLRGVTIGVICWNGHKKKSFYGITNKLGNFKVKLSGFNLRKRDGHKSCQAKLIYPAYTTSCMLPTNLHNGKLGAPLSIKSKNPHKLVLHVGPFAYTTPYKNKKCHHKGGRFITSDHKHYSSPSHPHTHSNLHAKYKSPSCPVYDCKTRPPTSYNHDSTLSMTHKKGKFTALEEKYKAVSPWSQSSKVRSSQNYFKSIKDRNSSLSYFKSIKDHNSHKMSSHSPPFPTF